MINPLKYLLPIAIFMGIAASAAQAQDANCNCGEIVKQLQEENEQLKAKLAQVDANEKRRAADSQALIKELNRLQEQRAANSSSDSPNPTHKNGKSLSPKVVKEALTQINQEVQVCGKDGKLSVTFGVDEKGKVVNLQATGGEFKDTPIEKCILTIIEVRRLPGRSPSPSPGSGGAEFAVFRGLARVRALGRLAP